MSIRSDVRPQLSVTTRVCGRCRLYPFARDVKFMGDDFKPAHRGLSAELLAQRVADKDGSAARWATCSFGPMQTRQRLPPLHLLISRLPRK